MEQQGQLVIQVIVHDSERERSRKLTIHRQDCTQRRAIEVFSRFQEDNKHIEHLIGHWIMYPIRIK